MNQYQIKYSQNFIHEANLAHKLVQLMKLKAADFVIEIGPGKGALTQFIVKQAGKVVGVEMDKGLYEALVTAFPEATFFNQDFLDYRLPHSDPYKVVGNIPFAITTEIIKKLMEATNAPADFYLIMQKEAALRIIGSEHTGNTEYLLSMLFKPWFSSDILWNFRKSDFTPVPGVDVVLLHVAKRTSALVEAGAKKQYQDFITYCFSHSKKDVRSALEKLFSYKQLGIIAKELNLDLKLLPSQVGFETWLQLFETFRQYSPEAKQVLVYGAYRNMLWQQTRGEKIHRSSVSRNRN